MKTPDNRVNALIIDDEIDICYLLKSILRYKNIEADFVNSLSEAHRILHDREPSLIFLDNHLTDGLGVQHIKMIKQEHPGSIIIMITAHDTATDRQLAYSEGVDYFISKPFTRETILQTVDKACA